MSLLHKKLLLNVNLSITNRKVHFHGVYKSSFGKSGPNPRLTSSVIIANITVQHSDLLNGTLISEIHQIPRCLSERGFYLCRCQRLCFWGPKSVRVVSLFRRNDKLCFGYKLLIPQSTLHLKNIEIILF